jgi:hypothetical protein
VPRNTLSFAEALLITVCVAMLMGSVFLPEPFKVLGYEFIPPRLRIPAEVALVLGLALPPLIPLVSDRLERLLES